MRVALLALNACAGDAIGNQLAGKVRYFTERGWEVRVFVESSERLHADVAPFTRQTDAATLWADPIQRGFLCSSDLVIAEFGVSFGLLHLLPALGPPTPAPPPQGGRGKKGRILFEYHGVTPPELWEASERWRLEAALEDRGLAWCADRVIAKSRFTEDELIEATGLPAERVTRVPCFAEVRSLSPRTEYRGRGEKAVRVLLYVGRLAKNKRVPLLVEAVAQLPAVHALIIGEMGDAYATEAERCRGRAAELGITDRVHLLGRVSDAELHDWYRTADVLVMPSLHEGFCIPAIEAMAHGLPVVAARAGALPETLGDAGLSFEPEDVDDLARQVRRVLSPPPRPSPVKGEEATNEPRRGSTPQPRVAQRTLGDTGTAVIAFNPEGVAHDRGPSPCATPSGLNASQPAHDFPGLRVRNPGLWSATPSGLPSGEETLPTKVAIVATRFGHAFAGGAERSLARIATALHEAGHQVEVFTTCAVDEVGVRNTLPAGTSMSDGLVVHRFPTNPRDLDRYRRLLARAQQGTLNDTDVSMLLTESLNSTALVAELVRRQGEFDAIIVGPYVHGLTYEVARQLGTRVAVLPCFHDEPLARLSALRAVFREVAGIFYHTPEEQHFAEAELGINQPNCGVIGTWLDADAGSRDAARGRALCGSNYIVYCGRYCREKGFERLLEWMSQAHGNLSLVVMGQADAELPPVPWLRDLGFVAERIKRDVLAGARALVLLSENESLSLVTLEAWAAGVPVIASRRSAVLCGQIARSGGGVLVGSCHEFAAALDDLSREPERWRALGAAGRAYVQGEYLARDRFVKRIEAVLHPPTLPELLREHGVQRARNFTYERWAERFGAIVDELLATPQEPRTAAVRIEPLAPRLKVRVGTERVLVPVRVTNVGNCPVAGKGPAAVDVQARLSRVNQGLTPLAIECRPVGTRLPRLLAPRASQIVVVPIPVPADKGSYLVEFDMDGLPSIRVESERLTLEVGTGESSGATPQAAILDGVRKALSELHTRQTLPDDYQDVTQGMLAEAKRSIKKKLLHNFRTAYVDVLSRQQSAFNERVVTALCQLADAIAVGAAPSSSPLLPSSPSPSLGPEERKGEREKGRGGEAAEAVKLLRKTLRRQRRIEWRLAKLEQQLEALARICP